MGRMIDADVLREEINSWGMNDYEPSDFTDAIDDAPTVEAIPKDQYKERLKADLVAMLTELQLEIEECNDCGRAFHLGLQMASKNIQQKIDKLKENKEQEIRA